METLSVINKKWRPAWRRIMFLSYCHLGALYGIYCLFTVASWKTWLFVFATSEMALLGSTVGAHRLWSHHSFSAKLPLRIFLAICQTATFQRDIYYWVRDHRIHHKYSDTEFDPHNASRGLFWSHIGWMMCHKPEGVISKGQQVDLSDLETDPVVMFQKKYYWYLVPFVTFLIPALIPWYFWNELLWTSWNTCALFRVMYCIHATSLINSVAHKWDNKPYDKNICPAEVNFVSQFTFGEGYHNYHHTFPWDYRAAEMGYGFGNHATMFINAMAKIGQASNLKFASKELIEKRARRTGDGSWKNNKIDQKSVGSETFDKDVVTCNNND